MSTEDTAPAPPTGYRPYMLDPDPSPGMVARVLAAGWVLAVVVLGGLVWLSHEQYTALGVVGVVLVTTVVHEAVHAVVGWMLGLELTAGVEFDGLASGPYVLPYGSFQTRRETALLAAAPTLVLSPVLLLLVVVGGTATVLAALAALFLNTVGAVFDLRAVMTTLRLPAGALTYPAADGELHFYAPASAG
jgi:hypothetical protein